MHGHRSGRVRSDSNQATHSRQGYSTLSAGDVGTQRYPETVNGLRFGIRKLSPEHVIVLGEVIRAHGPHEIRVRVIDRKSDVKTIMVSQATLSSCCLVCRTWRDIFTTILYSNIYIANGNQATKLLRTLRHTHPKHIQFIQSMTLDCFELYSPWTAILAISKDTGTTFTSLHSIYIIGLQLSHIPRREFRWSLQQIPLDCKILLSDVRLKPHQVPRFLPFLNTLPSQVTYTLFHPAKLNQLIGVRSKDKPSAPFGRHKNPYSEIGHLFAALSYNFEEKMMNRRSLPREIPSIREHLHLQSKREAEEQERKSEERLKEAEMRWLKGGEVLERTKEALQREREALQRARGGLQQAREGQVAVRCLRNRKAEERVREAKERLKEAKERVKEAEEQVRGAEEWVRGAKEQVREFKERRLRGTPLRLEAQNDAVDMKGTFKYSGETRKLGAGRWWIQS